MDANTSPDPGRSRSSSLLGTIAVTMLILLAGCSGVVPFSDDETDRSPYAVDDELEGNETETTPAQLAPGLTSAGIEDVSALLEHHFDTLERESGDGTYTVRENSSQTENETLTADYEGRYVVQYPERWHESSTRTTDDGNATEANGSETELWVGESASVYRSAHPGEPTTYTVEDGEERAGHPPHVEMQLSGTLSIASSENANVTVEERPRNSTAWYVVTATQVTAESDAVDTITVHVREDGFVESASSRTTDGQSQEQRVLETSLEFEVTANETLERPEWYDEALEDADTE